MKRRPLPLYVLSFLLPACLLLACYACLGMAPFGDGSILAMDMSTQYVDFFCALKQGDLFFSWSKGLGSAYIGVFSYYVSSPLSLLTLLVPNDLMPMGLLFLTVLKVGLAGLAFSVFSVRRNHLPHAVTLLGALAYSLCSWSAAYSMCIMWLDGLIWLPLLLLALEHLMDGGSPAPMCAALAACFVSTWYISYMLGGFCVLWLVYRGISRRLSAQAGLKVFLRLCSAAVWALCAAAWLWLPTLLAMTSGKLNYGAPDYTQLTNFPLLQLLRQLLPGQYQGLSNLALPFLFCGVLTPLLFLLHLLTPSISLRERLAGGGLALVLVLSLWLAPLDKIWHLFLYPNWFPYRYAFLLSFVLIMGAQKALGAAAARIQARTPPLFPNLWAGVLTVVLCFELGYNTLTILQGIDKSYAYASFSSYQDSYNANQALVDTAQARAEGFFRLGATQDRGLNSPLAFGYPGITHYSSVYNGQVNQALRRLGFAQSWMWCAYYGSTPFTDALLGIRYVISADAMPSGYRIVDQAQALQLWENPTCLPLAFSAPQQALDTPQTGTAFDTQNALFAALTGEHSPLFTPAEPAISQADRVVTLSFQGSGQPIYADLDDPNLLDVTVNGQFLTALDDAEEQCIHYLGTPAPGETLMVRITASAPQNWAGCFARLDLSLLNQALAPLAQGPAPSVEGSRLTLTTTVEEGEAVLTTIPAEDGWRAYVDGQPAQLTPFFDTFLAVEVPPGTHTIQLRYTTPGAPAGLALTGVSALWALAWLLRRRLPAAP